MPSDTMHVNVNFTNWSQHFSDPEKSLINFFFKDAVVRFYGVYDNGDFSELHGNIQSPYRLYSFTDSQVGAEDGIDVASSYFLDMPLSVLPTFPLSCIGNIMPEALCDLRTVSSRLFMCKNTATYDGNDEYTYTCSSVHTIGGSSDSSNAVLTFFRGSTANTDPTFRPSQISSSNPLLTLNMVVPVGTNLRYDLQLKTDEFRIVTTGNVTYGCYYKIGILPLNSNTVASVSTYLTASARKFCIGHVFVESDVYGVGFTISDSSASGYTPDRLVQENTLGTHIVSGIVHKSVFPLMNPSDYNHPYGILYIELYNSSTDEPLTEAGSVSKIQKKQGSSWVDCVIDELAELSITAI